MFVVTTFGPARRQPEGMATVALLVGGGFLLAMKIYFG
jgi:hypothetical protein